MKLEQSISVEEISQFLNARYEGEAKRGVSGINEIHKVEPGDLTFVDHPKYYDKALASAATFIIINKEMPAPKGKVLLFSDDPFRDYNKLTKYHRPFKALSSQKSGSAEIGEGTIMQPGVVIGHHVKIGIDCIIHPNVVVYDHTVIGDRVIIHANTVIGADAFYFKKRSEREAQYDKLYSCGRVIIENDVEIGAGCTIDKGVSGDTIIGLGTKLDNQVHVGHGTVIGRNGLIAAQTGIAGKVRIGNNVTLWGQVGVSKDLEIGDNTVVMAQSGVPKSLKGNASYFGSPVEEARKKMKELAALKHLPEIWQQWIKS